MNCDITYKHRQDISRRSTVTSGTHFTVATHTAAVDIESRWPYFCFQLREAGVIDMDEDEFAVTPTPQGVLFSRFMIRFDSMKAIMSVSEENGTK